MLQNYQYARSRENYRRSVRKARLRDLWGGLTGARTDLVRFADVAQPLQLRQQIQRGVVMVPLKQIVGSVGRAQDFTGDFLPRPKVSEDRWAQLEVAFQQMVVLPAVELYQIGTVYFVRDGHHRISVAQVNGLCEVEANVVELVSPVQLQVEDFQRARWLQVVNQEQEKTMVTLNYEMAKLGHTERLHQAEQTYLVQSLPVNKRTGFARLLGKFGDLLVTVGTNLKAQLPQELVEA